MFSVEPLRIIAVYALHARREIGLRRFNEQVVVVRHEAEAMNVPSSVRDHLSHELGEEEPISVAKKDRLLSIASTRHVIDAAGNQDAWTTRHVSKLSQSAWPGGNSRGFGAYPSPF
jgi:hypothetical protein